ncbi:hypothetical protein FEM48_Zijuj08G0131900 [Ziziphus jujuba var. spinosa]|uniref:Retrovirus-related Pol polyprotein from transposon TNT 1-94-like beta-barrel domain-containing protein n=1 Tax=Ziziphus jujuba var. spinosa TaxID=714518 RepID=A0A978UZA7_ZIZJJ|nr:hypothetical protein FEM48_Zijuj08G0131900 [Ziziphus jujuba var. spinosa]
MEVFSIIRSEEVRRNDHHQPENSALTTSTPPPITGKNGTLESSAPMTQGTEDLNHEEIDKLRAFLSSLDQSSGLCSLATSGYSPCSGQKIKVADGALAAVAGHGTIALSSSLSLKSMLHVPKLSVNLLSFPKIIQDLNCHVIFSRSRLCVLGKYCRENDWACQGWTLLS